MYSVLVHNHRVQLRGHPGVEDQLTKVRRYAFSIVKNSDSAQTIGVFRSSDHNCRRPGIPRISQHLDHRILDLLDVMARLSALSLSGFESNKSIAQVLFDSAVTALRKVGYKVEYPMIFSSPIFGPVLVTWHTPLLETRGQWSL